MANFVENFKKDKVSQILCVLDVLKDQVENKRCGACVYSKVERVLEHGYPTVYGYCSLNEEGYKDCHCSKFEVRDIDKLVTKA